MTVIQSHQILLPKKVYIGDSAELRITFSSDASFSQNTPGTFAAELNQKECVIQNIQFFQSGINYYQLSITFIPWKTGTIQLPAYVLTSNNEEYIINLEPISIVSLVEQNEQGGITSSIQNQNSPLLIPGTTYKIWIGLIIFTLLLIVGIRLIIKRKEVSFFIKNKKLMRKYKKNRKQTIKKLKAILQRYTEEEKSFGLDKSIAEEIQLCLRNYLETRFKYPFKKTVSSEIMNRYNEATGGMSPEAKQEAAGEIAATFIRTDYIRYAKAAVFLDNEVSETIQKLITNIETLEAQNV